MTAVLKEPWPRVVLCVCRRCGRSRRARVRDRHQLADLGPHCQGCAKRETSASLRVPDTLAVMGAALAELARRPTAANPGSDAKISILAARAELIKAGHRLRGGLFHPRDSREITVAGPVVVEEPEPNGSES